MTDPPLSSIPSPVTTAEDSGQQQPQEQQQPQPPDDDPVSLATADATLTGLESSLRRPSTTTTTTTPTAAIPRGQAVWNSVASSLTALRQRLGGTSIHSNSNSGGSSGSRGTTPRNPTDSSTTASHQASLQQRLSAAELAHASRRPLERIPRPSTTVGGDEEEPPSMPPPSPATRSRSESAVVLARRCHNHDPGLCHDNHDDTDDNDHHAFSRQLHERVQKRARIQGQGHGNNNNHCGGEQKKVGETTTPMEESPPPTLPSKEGMIRSQSLPIHQNNNNSNNSIVPSPRHHHPPKSSTQTTDLLSPESSAFDDDESHHPGLPGSRVYSWGGPDELTLHEDHDRDDTDGPQPPQPLSSRSKLGRPGAPAVVAVACGDQYTVCATAAGSVYYVTKTTHHEKEDTTETPSPPPPQQPESPQKKLRLVENLYSRQPIRQISCGYDHTAAVTVDGTVLTWGYNHYGQLGRRSNSSSPGDAKNSIWLPPQRVMLSSGNNNGTPAAMVACGHYFTIILTQRMQVLVCGIDCIAGSDPSESTTTAGVPTRIPTLQGMPIVFVAAGNHHAVVLTSNGTAYAWGKNDYGCCGRSYPPEFRVPVPMHLPDDKNNNETLVVEHDKNNTTRALGGSTNSFRTNTQLTTHTGTSRRPHPFRNFNTAWQPSSTLLTFQQQQQQQQLSRTAAMASEDWARSLPDHMAIVHAACGQHHTVLVTRSGRLLVCGDNSRGQLGLSLHQTPVCGSTEAVYHPQANGQFVSAQAGASHTLLLDHQGNVWQMGCGPNDDIGEGLRCVLEDQHIHTIAAGGDGNNVAIAQGAAAPRSIYSQPLFPIASDQRDKHNLLTVFASPSETKMEKQNGQLALGSEDPMDAFSIVHSSLLEVESSRIDPSSPATEIGRRTEELLQNPAVMNSLFVSPRELDGMYEKLIAMGGGNTTNNRIIISAIEKGIKKGLDSLLPENPEHARMMYPEAVRCLLVYIRFFDRPPSPLKNENDETISVFEQFDARGTLISRLMETILALPFEGYKAFLKWATSIYPGELFVKMLVNPLLFQLEKSCRVTVNADGVIRTSLSVGATPLVVSVLDWLYNASQRLDIVKPEYFACQVFEKIPAQALYHDLATLKAARASSRGVTHFYICESPFLFSPGVKRNLLKVENQVEMMKAAYSNVIAFNPATGEVTLDAFFKLEIDRSDILRQTLSEIKKVKPSDLRKSLRVKFRGEEGVDAGGVTKEFFQLLSEELFDVSSGMWTKQYGEDVTWFNPNCMWEDVGFELTGVLVGLALYNSVLLDVHFPMAVYRKLLGYSLGLEDMVDAELKRGLQQLLDYEGDDVEDIFSLSFEVAWVDDLKEERKRELKPGGSKIPVTADNREEYVRLYVTWLLVDSIYPQWVSFETGVQRVLEGSSIGLCRPEEVELLVVGSPELDFDALEAHTEYEGGYDENSTTIQSFWRFIKSMDRESQTNFLKFATGSPRAPIGGLGELKFKIQRAGPDSPQLPTSHTCFNTLLLPDYETEEKLWDLLGRAIVECEGFGLE